MRSCTKRQQQGRTAPRQVCRSSQPSPPAPPRRRAPAPRPPARHTVLVERLDPLDLDPAAADVAPSVPPSDRKPRALRLTKDLDLLRGLAADATGEGLGVVRLATQIGRDKSQVSR